MLQTVFLFEISANFEISADKVSMKAMFSIHDSTELKERKL